MLLLPLPESHQTMKHFILPIVVLFASGCATPDKAGVRNPEWFAKVAERSVLTSDRPFDQVAQCFERNAQLLPMTEFVGSPDQSLVTYRLRGFGYTFEEIAFEASTGGGSTATVLIAPNLNARWRYDFKQDRLEPLHACVANLQHSPA